MNQKMSSYIKSKDYYKLHKSIVRGYTINGFFKKRIAITDEDKKETSKVIEKDIRETIYKDSKMPDFLITTYTLLNSNYLEYGTNIVKTFTIPKLISKLVNMLEISFLNIKGLPDLISDLFSEYNKYIHKYNAAIKEVDIRILYYNEVFKIINGNLENILRKNFKKDDYVTSLIKIIGLYKVEMDNVRKEFFSKILKILFLQVKVYYNYKLADFYKKEIINYKNVEENIYTTFISLFWKIKELMEWRDTFNNLIPHFSLFEVIDDLISFLLLKLMREIKLQKSIYVYSSINFIDETLSDISSVYSDTLETYKFKAIDIISKIEQLETNILRKKVFSTLRTTKLVKPNFPSIVINLFNSEITAEQKYLISDKIKNIYSDIFMNELFVLVLQSKINETSLSDIISNICQIDSFLIGNFKNSAIINNIKNYLKIASFPTSDSNLFVQNYFLYSNNFFKFDQILKLLKIDDKKSLKLIETYKSFCSNNKLI